MDEEEYYYYQRLEEEKKMESNHEITDIDQFLSFKDQEERKKWYFTHILSLLMKMDGIFIRERVVKW